MTATDIRLVIVFLGTLLAAFTIKHHLSQTLMALGVLWAIVSISRIPSLFLRKRLRDIHANFRAGKIHMNLTEQLLAFGGTILLISGVYFSVVHGS